MLSDPRGPIDLNLNHISPPPGRTDARIGVIGAGFIIRDVQLVAYRDAGYNVAAIASRSYEVAQEVADVRGVPKVYEHYEELFADRSIEILDIAVPPHSQLEVVRAAVRHNDHVKGILCQKPLATNYREAREIVRLCEEAGITLAVNQNMRFDQSIRALKTVLDRGYLGEPVLGTIEMRAVPHWQHWLTSYGRLTLLNMSVHHLDCFRFLFGDPESVFASARRDPRTKFPHQDGICMYVLEYENGFRAGAWDDVWTGPGEEGAVKDWYIRWRVEGTEGMAQGTIGWPSYPNRQPSTLDFTTMRQPGYVFSPRWKEVWFPDAFAGTMGQLLDSVARGVEPTISGRDNLRTMALIEACYRSLQERRLVSPNLEEDELKEVHETRAH
ncbi:MAG TPA: Gfo/Idh/MocA family oxidoreductase [Bryobacteraceae bacterium]|nr:Gfo/Idh/MocA family oxidoreductase [Bryobacteraceae bacterium]